MIIRDMKVLHHCKKTADIVNILSKQFMFLKMKNIIF